MGHSDETIGGHDTISAKTVPAAPDPPDQRINTVLDGRYLIERELGHGGFGTVYLATDNKVISRKIVVKVMHSE
jgi:serine/threonine protein kinase